MIFPLASYLVFNIAYDFSEIAMFCQQIVDNRIELRIHGDVLFPQSGPMVPNVPPREASDRLIIFQVGKITFKG